MALLRNSNFAGRPLVTQWGKLIFNENGEVEVSEDAGKKLGTLKGFSFVSGDEVKSSSDDEENSQETENTTPESSENESEAEEYSEEATSEDKSEDEDAAVETTTYTEEELNKKNVPQLKKIAKDLGLSIPADAKKQQVITAIIKNQ